jgi:hypothetical protein
LSINDTLRIKPCCIAPLPRLFLIPTPDHGTFFAYSDIKDPFVMDMQHAQANPYQITCSTACARQKGALVCGITRYFVTSDPEQTVDIPSEDFSEDFSDLFQAVGNLPANNALDDGDKLDKDTKFYSKIVVSVLPSAKFQHLIFKDSSGKKLSIDFYTTTYRKLLMVNADAESFKTACSSLVMRFKKYYTNVNSTGRLKYHMKILMRPNDTQKCVSATIGPGLPLSSWPPGMPFLHNAARLGCASIVDVLLDYYACSVNIRQGSDYGTALHVAAYYGHVDVVRTLLQHKANRNIKNKFNETPLESARKGKAKYYDPNTREDWYPVIIRAETRNGVWHPAVIFRFGTAETNKTHSQWTYNGWNAIIELLTK